MTAAQTPTLDNALKTPRYMQVYLTLHQWIADGRYPPGSALEPESTLCEMFGVSRITIRRAIEMLVREKHVESFQGKGTFVRNTSAKPAIRADMDQRIDTARKMARNSKITELHSHKIEAPAEVANDLKLAAGTLVHAASYVRILRGEAVGFVESWFKTDLALTLNAKALRNSTMLTILEDQGIKLSGINHLIGATLADAQLATRLGINLGAPLVRVKMIMLDTHNTPIERVQAFFRADRYEHHMFMTRPGLELNS